MGNNDSKHNTNVQKRQMMKQYIEELEKKEDVEYSDAIVDLEDYKECPEFTSAASQANPEKLLAAFRKKHSIIDEKDSAALRINPAEWKYPFENIVLEGGGNKGLAYVGVAKCFEDLGMMGQVKRIGGTSAGAISAALLALGYNSDEVLSIASADLESIFMDHSCGYLSLIPNLIRKFGWNPGYKAYEWLGKHIESKTGDPDTTFYELYQQRGVELCIVVTNLNLMTAQYCHPKTAPNMPIRDALRMTMAIPGVFSPLIYEMNGTTDVFVDGGVLVNYPINCFDGWFLSMDKKDSFLTKLNSLSNLPATMASSDRFEPTKHNKTIGFLLFDSGEREIMRFGLEKRVGAIHPARPKEDTQLWLAKQEKKRAKIQAQRSHERIVVAVESLLKVLQKHNIDDQEFISREELAKALKDEEFGDKNREVLFGDQYDLEKAFDILDKNCDDKISFFEVIQFIEERGIRMQVRFQGYKRREVNSLFAFLMAMQETLLTNLKYTAVGRGDEHRTVGINTEHISTLDYNLEKADLEFIVERGYNATMSFLRYFAAEHQDQVTKREVASNVQSSQPDSIHAYKRNGTAH